MVEAHGSYSIAHCITCGKAYPTEFVKGMQHLVTSVLVDYVGQYSDILWYTYHVLSISQFS